LIIAKEGKISFGFPLKFEDFINGSSLSVGEFRLESGLQKLPAFSFRKRPKYFRIGIVEVIVYNQFFGLACKSFVNYYSFHLGQ
jgi:hypothetical protein